MKLQSIGNRERGTAIITVIILSAVTLLILGGILRWSSTNVTLSHRNNQYYKTVAVAEAATEKVLTRIDSDYKKGGDSMVSSNLATYRTLVPTADENALYGSYQFSDGGSQAGKTYVEFVPPSEFRNLTGLYRGLYGYSSIFRVISNARDTSSRFSITGAVRQDVELTTIPLFQFAIFYNLDLEINPGPVMTVTGPVHGNRHIYLQPQDTLTFRSDVTAAGNILKDKHPLDPVVRCGGGPCGTIVFQGESDSGVSSLNLPVGTNNSPIAVRQIVESPTAGEEASSPLAKERFYNKANLIVTIATNGAISVTSGITNNRATIFSVRDWDIRSNSITGFLAPKSFYNKRESKTVTAIDIDVGKLRVWASRATNIDVNILYVEDKRLATGSTEPGVRVTNGMILPIKGLTVATRVPIYVRGHYNIQDATGTSSGNETSHTRPAALIGDAITVLSRNWNDDNSDDELSARTATATTVNAAFLAGIVQTVSGSYSGGVENFPRFLENWSGVSFTYNGSMVVMYDTQVALGLWRGTGEDIGIYNPPIRSWAFDMNFRDPVKLPPGTPCVRALIRSGWSMIQPNTTVSAL